MIYIKYFLKISEASSSHLKIFCSIWLERTAGFSLLLHPSILWLVSWRGVEGNMASCSCATGQGGPSRPLKRLRYSSGPWLTLRTLLVSAVLRLVCFHLTSAHSLLFTVFVCGLSRPFDLPLANSTIRKGNVWKSCHPSVGSRGHCVLWPSGTGGLVGDGVPWSVTV